MKPVVSDINSFGRIGIIVGFGMEGYIDKRWICIIFISAGFRIFYAFVFKLHTKTIIELDGEGGSEVNSTLFCTGDFWNLFYQVDQHINKWAEQEVRPSNRKEAYLFDFPYQKTDTTTFILPEGTIIDNLPAKKEISNRYVYYKSESLKKEGENKVYVITELSVKERVVPSYAYAEVAESFRLINQNESQKIVLKTL